MTFSATSIKLESVNAGISKLSSKAVKSYWQEDESVIFEQDQFVSLKGRNSTFLKNNMNGRTMICRIKIKSQK